MRRIRLGGEALRHEVRAALEDRDEPFEGVGKARAGAVEHLVAVDEEDAGVGGGVGADGREQSPPSLAGEGSGGGSGGGEVKATGAMKMYSGADSRSWSGVTRKDLPATRWATCGPAAAPAFS